MQELTDQDREVARLLERGTSEPIPEPPADLVQRSIRAVRSLIVLGDVIRFATFEPLWQRVLSGTRSRSFSEAGKRDTPDPL